MTDAKPTFAEILKKHGLDIAEDAIGTTIKGIFEALPEILLRTENKYDDMLIPLLGVARPQIMKLVDKIDGKEG